ncbi:MAG TPA: hypothetical protein VHE30_30565 [Polyangiaceae bacterium]|nr:hypothetical protein [Polyangiaceae bacterium]
MPGSASSDRPPPYVDRTLRKAPQRGVTEVRGSAQKRDPRADNSVPPGRVDRSTGVRSLERPTDPAPPEERSESIPKAAEPTRSAPAADTGALDARIARLEAALDTTRAELAETRSISEGRAADASAAKADVERLRSELSAAIEKVEALSSKLESERDERVATTETLRRELDTTLALARERMESLADRTSDAAPSRRAMNPEAPPAPKRPTAQATPKADLPLIQIPQSSASTGGGFLKGALVKAALLAAVGAGLYAAERKEIAKTAATLLDMPKEAGTKTSMANILSMVQADFVNAPLPAPDEFSSYLKSRAVANQEKAALDGWGHDYRLDVNPSALRSAGSDGKFDTPDDLVLEIEAKKNESFH